MAEPNRTEPNRSRRCEFALAAIVGAMTLAGCDVAEQSEPGAPTADGDVADGPVSGRAGLETAEEALETLGLADEVGLEPVWITIGSLVDDGDDEQWEIAYNEDAETVLAEVVDGPENHSWVAVHVPSRTVYLVSLDAGKIGELSDLAAGLELDGPSHVEGVPSDLAKDLVGGDFGAPTKLPEEVHAANDGVRGFRAGRAPLGSWSGGVDTRTRRAIADGFSSLKWPFRTIGRMGNCTGTMVGVRHVLTAAHCTTTSGSIYSGSATVATPSFSPRRNFAASPWGTHSPIWVWWPSAWVTCTTNCNEWDISLMVLDKWGNGHSGGHPGWLGYMSNLGTAWLTKRYLMRGYPVFSANNAAPAAMVSAGALWGDTEKCDIGSSFSPDASGDDREATFDCDGSDGQSGSAIYRKSNGSTRTYGVYSGADPCQNSSCSGQTFVNTMTVLTPAYAGVVNWFKDQCPTTTSSCSF